MTVDSRRQIFPLAALFVIVAAMLLCGYWWFFPEQVVVVKNCHSVSVDKRTYAPGDRVIYLLDYCKTREIQGNVSRAIVNGIVIPYAVIDSVLPIGCRKILVGDLKIPEFMPSGIHHIIGTGEYQVNPLRKATNSWRTEDFEVVNPLSPPAMKDIRKEIDKNTDDIEQHHKEDKAWQKKHSALGQMNSFARSGDPTGPGRGVKTMPGYLRALASTGGHRFDGPRKVKG